MSIFLIYAVKGKIINAWMELFTFRETFKRRDKIMVNRLTLIPRIYSNENR